MLEKKGGEAMATKEPRTVHSVDKAMELLELLLQNRLPLSLQ